MSSFNNRGPTDWAEEMTKWDAMVGKEELPGRKSQWLQNSFLEFEMRFFE